ncbi:MAG: DUF3108 domain-containing protein [Blastocatellia bacterium]
MKKLAILLLLFTIILLPTTNYVFADKTKEEIKTSAVHIGEKLNYAIKWNNLLAAKMSLQTEKATKENKPFYRLELKLATVGLARDLFELNNHYTAFVDTKTNLPTVVERQLQQGTKPEQSVLIYDQEKHTVKVANEKPITIVPKTHDLSSILWAIRTASLNPEGERIALFNASDKKTSFIEVALGNVAEINSPSGKTTARELIVRLEDQEKVISDKYSIRIWVSEDKQRIPLLITATPSFGKVTIELLKSDEEETANK